jgi:plastocyanin
MNVSAYDSGRRLLILTGAGLFLSAAVARRADASDDIEVSMSGSPTGSHVWFRPRGLLIQPGQTVRWVNREAGNVHTVTAYHPDNGKPLRIPDKAKPWNSGYLMPGQSFRMVFDTPGVYDYFCIPHEHAGMVGRIVVGNIDTGRQPYMDTNGLLPKAAVEAFPSVATIARDTRVD